MKEASPVCEHLKPLENYLRSAGIFETFRGQAWSENCREWIYYNCIFDLASLSQRFGFPDCVQVHENNDPGSGTESGFVCTNCNDAIMGLHPQFSKEKPVK